MDRARVMGEAIHSGEMEGAYVSAEFRQDADEYVQGELSIEDLMRRTKRRWNSKQKQSKEKKEAVDQQHLDCTR